MVGYADLQQDGYIDHFFVYGQHQSCGIGAALMGKLLKEGACLDRIYTHASITARPFFQRYDFEVAKAQKVEVRGVKLKNYIMERIRNNK